MSEAWSDDEFNEDLFGESIDNVATRALTRLTLLREDKACELEDGDVQYEQYIGEHNGYTHTRVHTFTAAFDSLHRTIMQADIMSDYLHTIVAKLGGQNTMALNKRFIDGIITIVN